MKILMTADTLGGVWTYALELIRTLEPRGVQVALATMGRAMSREQRRAAARLGNLDVYESEYKLEWMDDPWDDLEPSGEWLRTLAARLRPDVVHFNHYAHGALPLGETPVIVAGHSCVLSWWEAVHGHPAPPEWDTYREVVTAGLRAADVVIAPSAAMLGALEKNYGPFGKSPAATRVIYNARRAGDFPPANKRNYIMTAGRLWDAAKNVAALEQVAPDLPWPVVAAGDTGGHPTGGTAIRYLGYLTQPHLRHWLGRASIYALPARYEPFGLSVLEAAYAGCALVLSDIPSLREIWHGAAEFVPPDDHDALRETLLDLIAHRKRREHLAVCAARRAVQFTPRRLAIAYMQLYKQVVARDTNLYVMPWQPIRD